MGDVAGWEKTGGQREVRIGRMRAALMGFDVPESRVVFVVVVLVVGWAEKCRGWSGRSQKGNTVVAGCRMV